MTGISRTRLYRIYTGIKNRCYSPTSAKAKWYYDKGIAMCDEWLGNNGIQNFMEWALSHGYEEHLTIDRIDSSGNYEPSNCRWVTVSQNSSHVHHGMVKQYKKPMMQKIQAHLMRRDMTLCALEKATGLGNGTIARWEHTDPGIYNLKRVADFLNVTVDELLAND